MSENSRSYTALTHLLLFGLAITIPLLLLLGALLLRSDTVQREQLESRVSQVLDALANDLDRDLDRAITILQTLATSEALKSGNWRAFYNQAKAGLQGRAYLILVDTEGRQLVNTYLPYGQQPPTTGDPETVRRMLETKRPVVSNLFVSLVVKKPVYNVSIPIFQDGQVRYVMSLGLLPDDLVALLASQKLGPEWVTLVWDAKGAILARSSDNARYLGKLLPQEMRERDRRTVVRTANLDGTDVLHLAGHSQLSGWGVGVNIPYSLITEQTRHSLLVWGAATALAIAIALALGLLFARQIASSLSLASKAAAAFGHGESFPITGSRLKEANAFLTTLRDAQRQREKLTEEVTRSRNWLHTTLSSIGDAVIATDPTGRVMFLNTVAESLTGWAATEAEGRPISHVFNIVNEHTRKAVANPALRAIEEGVIVGLANHTVLIAKDGTETAIDDAGAPIRDANGTILGAVLTFRDITARRLAEETLRASEERLRMALDAGHMGNWEWNVQTNEVFWSPELEAIHGLAPGGFAGTFEAYEQDVHPEDREPLRRAIAHSLEHGDHHVEYRIIPPDGRIRWVEGRGKVFHDESGAPLRLIGVCSDITARKRSEEALRQADRHKDEFLAMLSHELRNPLAALMAAGHVLNVADPSKESAIQARDVIVRQTNHMTHLIEDLLDITRVTMGKMALELTTFDLADAVSSVVETWRAAGRLEGAQVSVSVSPVWVQADRSRVEQIFSNLLDNALKFTPFGKRIVVSVRQDGTDAILQVTDDGEGISPEVIEDIFDPFVQGPRDLKRKRTGLGLGLALVKRLAEIHGGSTVATSEGPGRGTAFTVRIPTVCKPETQALPSTRPASADQWRILIIDDNDDARIMLEALLALDGHDVQSAPNGTAGVALAAQSPPDVALIDIDLPDFDGYEVARRLRSAGIGERTLLIALTGFGQQEDQRRALEAGFDAHLTKPIAPDDLMRVIADLQ